MTNRQRTAREIQELQSMVNQLTLAGLSASQIGIRLDLSARQVVRYRSGQVKGMAASNRRLVSAAELARRRALVIPLASVGYGSKRISDRTGLERSLVDKLLEHLRHEGLVGCCLQPGCSARKGGHCEWATTRTGAETKETSHQTSMVGRQSRTAGAHRPQPAPSRPGRSRYGDQRVG